MLKSIIDYFPTKKKARLFKQWVDNSSLPNEEVPSDLRDEEPEDEVSAIHHTGLERSNMYTTPISINRGMVSLPVKYVLLGISIITLQLVILSVISTILIMHS